MGRRASAVVWAAAAVAGGALLLAWVHVTATGYAPAHWAYEVDPPGSLVPMLVGHAALAVVGVCLASVGWWRPFLLAVAAAYLVPLATGGAVRPLLGDELDRLPAAMLGLLEAALLMGPAWLVAERGRLRPRVLHLPTRRRLPARRQPALASPERTRTA